MFRKSPAGKFVTFGALKDVILHWENALDGKLFSAGHDQSPPTPDGQKALAPISTRFENVVGLKSVMAFAL